MFKCLSFYFYANQDPSFDHAIVHTDGQIHFLFPGRLKIDRGNITIASLDGARPKALMDHHPALLISLQIDGGAADRPGMIVLPFALLTAKTLAVPEPWFFN